MREYSFTLNVGVRAHTEQEALDVMEALRLALEQGGTHPFKVEYVDADDFEDHG